MDGYVKNKAEAIATVRRVIIYKYATTFLILIFIPVYLLALAGNQPPKKWTQTAIKYSHISREQIGLRRGHGYVLNSQDGRKFVINPKSVDLDYLSESLLPGSTYNLVFSNTIAGGDHMEALFDESAVFQDLNDSISRWKREQREAVVAIIVILVVEIVALILIDRLWCKKEYCQIRKLKEDINHREERIKNKRTHP